MEILHSGMGRVICSVLLLLLLNGCSHPHEALWWNMMESHSEFSRVTDLVRQEQADRNFASDSVVVLSDSAIAYIERLEAALFTAADLEDTRNEQSLESDAAAYYDHRATTDILIGDETWAPRLGQNSAFALRLRMEGHKRSLEQIAGMRKGELDIYLSTDQTVRNPTGNLTMWEVATFYGRRIQPINAIAGSSCEAVELVEGSVKVESFSGSAIDLVLDVLDELIG